MGQLTVEWEGLVGLEREVAGLRRGDPEALAAILERYQHRLYRYLLRSKPNARPKRARLTKTCSNTTNTWHAPVLVWPWPRPATRCA